MVLLFKVCEPKRAATDLRLANVESVLFCCNVCPFCREIHCGIITCIKKFPLSDRTDNQRPTRYGDDSLFRFLFRYRARIEGDTQHALTYANLLLSKTVLIVAGLANSPKRQTEFLPSEILEQIMSHLPAQE